MGVVLKTLSYAIYFCFGLPRGSGQGFSNCSQCTKLGTRM
jgi:hypothetical protein